MKRKIGLGMFIAACAYIFLIVIASIHGYPSGDEFKGLAEKRGHRLMGIRRGSARLR